MNRFAKYFPLIISLLLYFFLWYLLQPLLGYNLDSDCVAYLTIAERVARGDYLKSVNGLWSPLNSWILAMYIKNGFDAWSSAKLLNALFGAVILIQTYGLFLKFNISRPLRIYLQIALSVGMVSFVYFQMFGDILQLIFVLFYLRVLWHSPSKITHLQAIASGILMGIAFYAKAYSFFFFAVHFLATLSWYVYQSKMQLKKAAGIYFAGIASALLTILPWTFALHQKYDQWSLNGMSGKLNMSWYINGGKSFRSDIDLLIPPPYDDSPSFWEDPFLSQQDLSGPFSSAGHFVKWVFRIFHTSLVMVFCFQEISFLAGGIVLIALFYFFFVRKKKEETVDDFQAQLLCITIGVLPLGYLMMHIETRYIWLNVMLLMLLGALLIGRVIHVLLHPILKHAVYLFFAASFIVVPVYQFENLKYKNKELFELAEEMNSASVKGRFTSNVSDAGRMWVVAYLTGSQFYSIEKSDYTAEQLLNEMERYQVKYYLFEGENNISEMQLSGMKEIRRYKNVTFFEKQN